MDVSLKPSEAVRGMKVLDRSQFRRTIRVPSLVVSEADVNQVISKLKKVILKMPHLNPVQTAETSKRILLRPEVEVPELPVPVTREEVDVELGYENWHANELLRAILPTDKDQLTSFSRIGHVLHLNLRDHLVEYKAVIAEILRDKTVGIRTVVNKAQTIDNTYRNFQLELLVGEPDYQVEVKENGMTFEFDFSSVYWNPRLSTEHEKVVKMLKKGDVLYDCCAGVGPFAVPAAKKGVRVLANDLNPESFRWLEHNIRRNKVSERVRAFNKDARDFIRAEIREDLLKNPASDVHITLNLPAMATTFLDAFVGLLPETPESFKAPTVHVYCFVVGENKEKEAQKLAEEGLGMPISDLVGVSFVRNVAPKKDMMRVDFKLTPEILAASPKRRSETDLEFGETTMGKHSRKKPQPSQQVQDHAKRKKDLKAFKLPNDLSKRINKKAKKVETKLKKIMPVAERREKVDSQLKNLHETLVMKKQPKQTPKMQQTPIPKQTDTKAVESDLGSMEI